MFTGIIQTVGQVSAITKVSGDLRLELVANEFAQEVIELGDSIACNGLCLTVIERKNDALVFDVSRESLHLSLIDDWRVGDRINMELAMLPSSRFGGHIVSGHVDGVAEIIRLEQDARSWRIWFKIPQELRKYIAPKGSVTIDGISLTVNAVEAEVFHINVVPHTLEVTTMGLRTVSDKVHIEVDLIARYLENLLRFEPAESKESVTEALLKSSGYLD